MKSIKYIGGPYDGKSAMVYDTKHLVVYSTIQGMRRGWVDGLRYNHIKIFEVEKHHYLKTGIKNENHEEIFLYTHLN